MLLLLILLFSMQLGAAQGVVVPEENGFKPVSLMSGERSQKPEHRSKKRVWSEVSDKEAADMLLQLRYHTTRSAYARQHAPLIKQISNQLFDIGEKESARAMRRVETRLDIHAIYTALWQKLGPREEASVQDLLNLEDSLKIITASEPVPQSWIPRKAWEAQVQAVQVQLGAHKARRAWETAAMAGLEKLLAQGPASQS